MAQQDVPAAAVGQPAAAELVGTALVKIAKLCGRDRKLASLAAAAKELQGRLDEVKASFD